MTLALVFRILHVLSAAVLVGSAIFNYFFVRRALGLLPPAHAVVMAQGMGTSFTVLGWAVLILLPLSGGIRLYEGGRLAALAMPAFYATGYGRWVGVMILFWLLTLINTAVMTFLLRPVLMRKLSVESNPTLSDVEKRRLAQVSASLWMERLQLAAVISSTVALVAGASIFLGGLF